MSEKQQGSTSSLIQQFGEIEKLIDNREYLSALAEIREVEAAGKKDCAPLETGHFDYLSTRVFYHLGNYQEALIRVQRAISTFVDFHDDLGIAKTQFALGLVYIALGDLKSAKTEIRDALTGYRRLNNLDGLISCLSRLSNIEYVKGNYLESVEYLQEAIAWTANVREPKKKAFLHGNLGERFLMMGNWREAEKNLLLNIALNRELENEINLCKGLLSLGYLYFLSREFLKATNAYEESLSLIKKNNCVRELSIYHEFSGELAFVQGDYQLAESHYREVFEIMGERAPQGDMISQTYRLLADLQVAKKEYDQAFSSCKRALEVSISLGERVEEASCYRILGQIYSVRNDKEKAKENFYKSFRILEEIKAKYELAKTYLEAGKSSCFDQYERLKFLGRVEDIFKELESKYHLGLVDFALSQLFLENREYEKSELFLKDAEKVFKELKEEKDLGLVQVFKKKLGRLAGTMDMTDPERRYAFSDIITQNKEMLDILEKAKQIKDTDITVLIEGETGTGKDLLAKCLHYESKRKDKKFVVVSCAAIPEALLESELFGHKKGAFTGASYDKKGLLEEADQGTLFLNEVADLPWLIQAKLLGVIENKELTRLGETKSRKVDFRVIAASNRDLEEEVRAKRFRDDLYYRLKVISFILPPLRKRNEDVPLLINHFFTLYSDNGDSELGNEILEAFTHHTWPGNVRELQNQIQRMISLSDGNGQLDSLEITEFMSNGKDNCSQSSLNELVASYEKEQIINALKNCDGTVIKAAKLLGIPWTTLKNKIKKYNLESPN